jgi:hypothetical protein
METLAQKMSGPEKVGSTSSNTHAGKRRACVPIDDTSHSGEYPCFVGEKFLGKLHQLLSYGSFLFCDFFGGC